MKKTLSLLLSALMLAGTALTSSATTAVWEENTNYVKLGEITAAAYPASTSTGLAPVTTGQLLKGTIFTSTNAQGIQCDGANSADLMFDAKQDTHYAPLSRGWAGLILDQAYELTEVRAAPNPNLEGGAMFNFWLQGSNDGENWADIIIMRQDATNNNYHVFTPQTVTDQRYIDAGYGKATDESIHWVSAGGSYSMYRVVSGCVSELELYGNPAPATELTPEIAATKNISTPYYNAYSIHYRTGAEAKSVDGSLVGTIIGGGGVWNKAVYERAFDNNGRTHYDPCLEGPECWVGMMFDEPHALTEVRVLPKRGAYTDLQYGLVQGSLDGINWRTLVSYTKEDVPTKQDWVIKPVTDTNGYTYFRYVSSGPLQSSCADLALYGAPAAAAEPFTVDPVIATHNKFVGPFHIAAAKNTVVDTEISGTPFCGETFDGWVDRDSGVESAFDGNIETHYGTIPRYNGIHFWVGLQADAATAVSSVKIYRGPDDITEDLYFQGSVDGINWVDLAVYVGNAETKDADGWYTKEISDATAYGYFRLINTNKDHPCTELSVYEMKIYAATAQAPETTAPETEAPAVETTAPETAAPETAAPETAAPETAAPETAAPETAAPETAAPETAAPETQAPETQAPETQAPETTTPDDPQAPATFDVGVIAAVAAVVSAAGYAISKKRK